MSPTPLPRTGAHRPLAGLTFGLAGVLAFSFTLPFTKLAVAGLDPLFVGAGRAVVAGVLAVALLRVRGVPRPSRRQLRSLLVVAAGVVAGFPLLTSAAMGSVPASHGAVVIGVLPAVTAVVSALRARERPGRVFWAAAAAGLLAVLAFLVAGTGGFGGLHGADALLLLAVLLAAAGYAEGGLLSRELGAWQTICWALVVSLPVTVPLAVLGAPGNDPDAPATAWLGFAYLAVFSMFLGFFAWYRGLAIGPMTTVSQVQLVQSVFTLAWSALFFGEQVGGAVWLAALVVAACAAAATRAKVRR